MKRVHRLTAVEGSDYLTIEEAARELRIKSTAVRNYLHAEKLTTYKFKTLTLISRHEVENWKERQRSR